ncbi:UDP-N-acetylmuramoyl-L-alanine--D-glutamate ligase [soil metagenome]
MRLDELRGRRVALLGLGADVRAAVDAIRAAGPAELVVVEEGSAEGTFVRRTLAEAATTAEVFVRSPGFPRYQVPLQEAMAGGAEMTTPLDLWLGTHGSSRTVVGITGTKGKSTVTDLLGRMAGEAGLDVGVAGNLGVPVFSDGWNHRAPCIVLEVSSYQAADLHHVPDVAVMTYLSEDHLSWHGGVDRYVADKLRLLSNEGRTAGRILVPAHGGRAAEVAAAAGLVVEVVVPPPAGPEVPSHRVQNAALAAAALAAVGGPGLDGPAIVEAARTSSLPGRLDECAGPAGLLCLDDALASNPSASAAGLAWVRGLGRPTVVVLGGMDRGVDPAPLVAEVARWEAGRLRAITLPVNGSELADRAGVEVVGRAEDVGGAVRLAIGSLSPGGVLLFSPAAPTPPGLGNWETRSRQFREALQPG